jgi:flagellar hook-basal body complex protein FliE
MTDRLSGELEPRKAGNSVADARYFGAEARTATLECRDMNPAGEFAMDLRLLTSIAAQGAGQAGALRGAQSAVGAAAAGAKGGATTPEFAKALEGALKSVSETQNQAAEMQRQYQLGAGSVSLEETMVAMQKAQIGFQAALTVRNRLVAAYSDIMNMQV